jgi:hypothetical protein
MISIWLILTKGMLNVLSLKDQLQIRILIVVVLKDIKVITILLQEEK